jgi:hypothetical protein
MARVDIPRAGLYVIQTSNRRWNRYAGHQSEMQYATYYETYETKGKNRHCNGILGK